MPSTEKPPHVRLFLSTVTAEFEPKDRSVAYRSRLRSVCTRPNVTVQVQEDFIATGNPTLDKLDDYIRSCDAVIHLVGDMTGAAAHPVAVRSLLTRYPDLAEKLPILADLLKIDPVELSYTQWEAYLAILHGKRLIIARPSESAPRGKTIGRRNPQRRAQASHLLRLEQHCQYPEITFDDANDLAAQVANSALLDLLAQAHALGAARIPFDTVPAAAKFLGRESQRAELVDRLRKRQNTVVVGAAGLGKTALAAAALEQTLGSTPESRAGSPFPDGVVFIDLYKFQGRAEPAWSALANSVAGPDFQESVAPRIRAESACRGRRLLVVLEGAEEADNREGRTNRSELLSIFSSENCWLLLTRDSRQALPHEKILLDETLSAADSGALLDSLTRGKVVGEVRDRILTLLDGHPLALTWAGSLLSQGDEHPATLARDWEAQPTLGLKDPLAAEHTLNWLFERSVRRLDPTARQALTAAGLLARAPFPQEAIQAAMSVASDEDSGNAAQVAHEALRQLTQRGLLRLSPQTGYREFTHVLGYRFARDESSADGGLRERMAAWMCQQLRTSVRTGEAGGLTDLLQHASALLRTDYDQRLWRPLANYLLYDARDRFVSMGRSDWTYAALDSVEVWLRQFPQAKAAEPDWQREQSVCCNRLGDLAVSQGNLPEAQRLFEEDLEIAQRLAESDPGNTLWQFDLGISNERLGNLAVAQGKLDSGYHYHSVRHSIIQSLAESDPGNTQWQRDLSVSFNQLGDLSVSQGNLAQAQRLFAEDHRIAQRLAASDPGNSEWQRDLSISFERLGALAVSQGNLPEAQRLFAESLRIAQRLAEADPGNAEWQRDLSVSLNKLGELAVSQGNLPEAQRLFAESLRIRQRLAESDPGNAEWQRDLSVSLNKLGELAVSQGNLPEAQRRFAEGLRIAQRLAESDPGNTLWQFDLGISNERLGNLAVAQGKLDSGYHYHSVRHSIIQRLAESDPGNTLWQRDLSVSFNQLGDLSVSQGNLSEAQRLFEAALRIAQRLAESDPGNAQWQRDLSVSLNQLGALAVSQGNLPEAQRLFGECHRNLQRLAESDPGNAEWQRDLSVSLNKLGALVVSQGHLPEAQRLFEESLRIRQRLAESDPGNAEWQRDLWVSHWRLANVLENLGSPEAMDNWRQALAALERMVSNGLFVSTADLKSLERLREKTRAT